MADLNQLKQKYAPVIQTIEQFSAEGARVRVSDSMRRTRTKTPKQGAQHSLNCASSLSHQ
jgi:hypothetical protein